MKVLENSFPFSLQSDLNELIKKNYSFHTPFSVSRKFSITIIIKER